MKAYLDPASLQQCLPETALLEIEALPFPHLNSGKVREIYDAGSAYLMIATDRLSAFDVILQQGIPGKGILLTQMSLYWFEQTRTLIDNHLCDNHADALAELLADFPHLLPRSMLVRKLTPLKIEAVVRNYLTGSGWKHYLQTGTVFGIPVTAGLRECDRLPTPLFTPTTKAAVGDHDLPLTPEQGVELLGAARYHEVSDLSLRLFALGKATAHAAGLILADTKFEFGTDSTGRLYLIDEVLTPDSSRYWPQSTYAPGKGQTAFDKQFVRDYLETLDWDKRAPGPELPATVIEQTRQRYLQAAHLLMPAS